VFDVIFDPIFWTALHFIYPSIIYS
jgi:hypothetical protein